MESKVLGMDAMKKAQTFDVLSGFFEDNDFPHARFDASRALSSEIVRNFPSPASTFAKRSESTSPCQSGGRIFSSECEKNRQGSFSSTLMVLISDLLNTVWKSFASVYWAVKCLHWRAKFF
jgi:hypothetical protein